MFSKTNFNVTGWRKTALFLYFKNSYLRLSYLMTMMLRPKYTYNTHGNMLRMLNISDNEKVFVRMEGEAIRYQYDNHLGSACLELDEYGYIISYEEYHPFGTTSYRAGRSATEVSWKRYKYCGKERDEETGLYYYGARYYASWLCRFVSVDPLKEKYPNISPYVYCADNPIKYIDPDGKRFTDYGVTSKGEVKRISPVDEKPDRLFAVNDDYTKKDVEPITISDKQFLKTLAINVGSDYKISAKASPELKIWFESRRSYSYKDLRYSETNDKYDAFNVFKFVSDHTDVEWALQGYNLNGKTEYVFGTQQEKGTAIGFNLLQTKYNNPDNLLFGIHNHPDGAILGASGYKKSATGDYGDLGVLKRFAPNAPRYIYNLTDKTIFQYNLKSEYLNPQKVNTVEDLIKHTK